MDIGRDTVIALDFLDRHATRVEQIVERGNGSVDVGCLVARHRIHGHDNVTGYERMKSIREDCIGAIRIRAISHEGDVAALIDAVRDVVGSTGQGLAAAEELVGGGIVITVEDLHYLDDGERRFVRYPERGAVGADVESVGSGAARLDDEPLLGRSSSAA